jgi:hypothetical protein
MVHIIRPHASLDGIPAYVLQCSMHCHGREASLILFFNLLADQVKLCRHVQHMTGTNMQEVKHPVIWHVWLNITTPD